MLTVMYYIEQSLLERMEEQNNMFLLSCNTTASKCSTLHRTLSLCSYKLKIIIIIIIIKRRKLYSSSNGQQSRTDTISKVAYSSKSIHLNGAISCGQTDRHKTHLLFDICGCNAYWQRTFLPFYS